MIGLLAFVVIIVVLVAIICWAGKDNENGPGGFGSTGGSVPGSNYGGGA